MFGKCVLSGGQVFGRLLAGCCSFGARSLGGSGKFCSALHRVHSPDFPQRSCRSRPTKRVLGLRLPPLPAAMAAATPTRDPATSERASGGAWQAHAAASSVRQERARVARLPAPNLGRRLAATVTRSLQRMTQALAHRCRRPRCATQCLHKFIHHLGVAGDVRKERSTLILAPCLNHFSEAGKTDTSQ